MKVVFLDRDGTIIKDYPEFQWPDVHGAKCLAGSRNGMKQLCALE